MHSPLRWVGGKSKSVKKLLSIIPNHYTYIEPFFGAGWLFFAKPKSKIEIINDINSELINFYQIILSKYSEFIDGCKYLIPSRELFNNWKAIDLNLSSLDRAIRFFYINRTCFSGDMQHPRFGISNIRRSNLCVATDDLEGFLKPIHERLKDVYIEKLDYKEIIKRYDQKESTIEKHDVFFYLDPPYKEVYGYENEFTANDHEELAKLLKSLKGKFILTINNDSDVLDWYNGFKIVEIDVMYKICKDLKGIGARKELIITNYE
jgi:DNA adenine methylase